MLILKLLGFLHVFPPSQSLNVFGWLVAITLVSLVVYSTYDQYKEGGEIWSKAALVAYDTFARTAYGLGIAWIIFACATGHGSECHCVCLPV